MTDREIKDPAIKAVVYVNKICKEGKLGIYLNYSAPLTRDHATAKAALEPIKEWFHKTLAVAKEKHLYQQLDLLESLAPLIFPKEEVSTMIYYK